MSLYAIVVYDIIWLMSSDILLKDICGNCPSGYQEEVRFACILPSPEKERLVHLLVWFIRLIKERLVIYKERLIKFKTWVISTLFYAFIPLYRCRREIRLIYITPYHFTFKFSALYYMNIATISIPFTCTPRFIAF